MAETATIGRLNGPTNVPSGAGNGGGPGLDISSLLYRLLRNWWLILIGLVLGYGAAKLYLRYRKIDYTVSATVQISKGETQAVQSIIGANIATVGGENTSLANEIQLMKSRNLLLQVVQELGIDKSVYTDGRVRSINLYKSDLNPITVAEYAPTAAAYGKLLVVDIFDDQRFAFGPEDQLDTFRLGLPFNSRYGRFLIERNENARGALDRVLVQFSEPNRVARSYADQLSIRPVGSTDLLEMQLDDAVPDRAKDVILSVIETYDSVTVELKNQTANRTLAFINERVGEFNEELTDVEIRAENFIRDNDLLVDIPTNLQIELNEFRQTEALLAEARIQLEAVNNVAEFLQQNELESRPIPYTATADNLNISGLIQQYNTLLTQRKELLATASPQNPVVKATEQPLADLEESLLDAVLRIRTDLVNEVDRLESQSLAALNNVRNVPGQRRMLLGIEREQQIKEQLYLYLLQKREETNLSQAITDSGMRLVEPPLTEGANQPESIQIYLIGLALGFLLPIGGVTVVEFLDNTVRSAEGVKSLTSAPLLGTLAENDTHDHIVVSTDSRTPIAEMFRMLRTNLRFLVSGKDNQTLLVTSSMSGEGKTFVCINLGVSLALAGHRVLIVGMDLRKPKLGRYLGIEDEQKLEGLSNYLVGSAKLKDIIQAYPEVEGLDYITSGIIPPNPAEIILMERNKELINELKLQYDYILIDTPPIALVTDALLLSDVVDSTLFVTRYGLTKRKQLAIVNELHTEQKFKSIAVILNGVKSGRGYGYKGYGYGYGYYMDNE